MSIYDGISVETLQSRLSAAQDAYHLLSVGEQKVSVRMGDKTVELTPAKIERLAIYIRELQAALGLTAPHVRGVYLSGGKGV